MTDGKFPYEIPGLDIEGEDVRIQKRAYEIWEDEGRPEGRALEHWIQAEIEQKAETEERLRLAEGKISSLSGAD